MLRDYKKPDLNAPRFRPRVHKVFRKELCDKLRAEHELLRNMSNEKMYEIIWTSNQLMQETAISVRDGIDLPVQLGTIFVGSTRASKKGNIDRKKSLELGKLVTHRNWDTDGLTCNIIYSNFDRKYRFKYDHCWGFEAVNQFKKLTSEHYLEDHTPYVVIEPWMRIHRMFQKRLKEQPG